MGTPFLVNTPKHLGAFPDSDIANNLLDDEYKFELAADNTAINIIRFINDVT